ncbi:hypothetical protein CORC01_12580 [Colletotrichum orchidophilum]|uniref:Uncharacterized protein n=1 Tax=Colletotrichum orchidophilum TaxID=1209926 RepID=A0A1G4ASN5_9PEZI|nr:uncharacterized protein CORC01_12580 [Colletotrichum orchidophilum]OHE92125.1 hypothetical protein CORC01_12580 [Colletotrichum orchidophilum]
MSAATPSEATMEATTDSVMEEGTPVNDNPIPIDLSSARRAKTPEVDPAGSSSLSSAASTPTKPASERHRATPKEPKLISHAAANKQLRGLIVAHNETSREYKKVLGLYKHLTREENAIPIILEACVSATSECLVQAIEDVEALESGNPPRKIPYPADMIPELLAAVETAEAERNEFYAENRRLFVQVAILEEELHALKAKVNVAKQVELDARTREGLPVLAAACQRPIAPSGLPVGTGTPINSTPAAVRRRKLTGEAPATSPALPESISQNSTERNFRTGTWTLSLDDPQTPTRNSSR